ncbi:MAG: Flp pilus assembly protein CpaB [Candidatus Omnitrophica bacterium]|nr:Flp pilus assembly protein CpaB [Candidatus Omnitrophota bacterium]
MPIPSLGVSGIKKHMPLAIAIIAGALAVLLINTYIKQKEEGLKSMARAQKEDYSNVVVAARDISVGTVLEERDVKVESVPKSAIQPRALTHTGAAIGKIASLDISSGEHILSNKIKLPGDETTLAMKTPAGKRAITLIIDNIAAVGGMIRPGDYVDVLGDVPIPMRGPDGNQVVQNTTMTMFQNILILAVGGQTSRGESSSAQANPPITLAVSPEEATLISFVHEQGKIRLSLRSPADSKVTKAPPASWDMVLQHIYPELIQKAQEAATAPAQARQVEIYRGLSKETVSLTGGKGEQ